jgi:magnesium transporter
MIDEKAKRLISTVKKLYHRDALQNIQRIFVKTHEADISHLLEAFEPGERFDLFKLEPSIEKRSQILSHLKPEIQKEILSCLTKQEALKIIALMDTDDVADLLGELPQDDAQVLLSSMTQEYSDEVSDLMGYPEDSAGGIMDSEFLSLNQSHTVNEAIKSIQEEDEDVGVAFYVYVVNDDNQLVGVLSLKTLLLSKNTEKLKDLMYTDVISVSVDTRQEQVAKVVEHYDFLSVPVVDSNNHLMGVITVDDILDVIREEAEENILTIGQAGLGMEASTFERLKARSPWIVLALAGGLVCFFIGHYFGKSLNPELLDIGLWSVAMFIPVLMSLGSTMSSQSATVIVGALRTEHWEHISLKAHFFKETQSALVFSIFLGLLTYFFSWYLFPLRELAAELSASVIGQVLISTLVGNLIPIGLSKSGVDATVASVPYSATISDILGVLFLFGCYLI